MINEHYYTKYKNFLERIKLLGKRDLEYHETHHILPRCLGGNDLPSNLIILTLREHHIAHWMLYHVYDYAPLKYAFIMMCEKNSLNSRKEKYYDFNISSRIYEKLKIEAYSLISKERTGKLYATNILTGEKEHITSEEFQNSKYIFHTKGMVRAFDISKMESAYVTTKEFILPQYIGATTNMMAAYDILRKCESWVTTEEYYSNDNLLSYSSDEISISKFDYIDTLNNKIFKMTKLDARNKNLELGYKRYKQLIDTQIKTVDYGIIPLKDYNPEKHTHVLSGMCSVLDTLINKYIQISVEDYRKEPERYITSTKGKVLAKDKNDVNCIIPYEEFNNGNYVGQTKGLTTVFDTETNEYKQITVDEFSRCREKYKGPCNGKINIINKLTGIRQQITSSFFDKEEHLVLGNKKQYFKCRNLLTNKIKNVSIYEWELVKDQYEIIDHEQFNKTIIFKEENDEGK